LGEGAYPISERIHRETLSLPMSPVMTDVQVDEVIHTVRSVCGELAVDVTNL
jgi:dTDP-4-amino-4,6-dideoxygalactose transaminase